MASRETRAFLTARGDVDLCPLPPLPLAEGEFDEVLAARWRGEHTLCPVFRESPGGEPTLIAEGFERQVSMRLERKETPHSWPERRLVVRSLRQAPAAAATLRARVAQARAQVEAVHQRGRGRKRFEDIPALRQAAHEIVQR